MKYKPDLLEEELRPEFEAWIKREFGDSRMTFATEKNKLGEDVYKSEFMDIMIAGFVGGRRELVINRNDLIKNNNTYNMGVDAVLALLKQKGVSINE